MNHCFLAASECIVRVSGVSKMPGRMALTVSFPCGAMAPAAIEWVNPIRPAFEAAVGISLGRG